jgi:hypothetical protein
MSVCVFVYPLSLLGNGLVKNHLTIAGQRLGRNVTAATNTHVTIEELLDASFSLCPVSYQGTQAIISSHNFLFLFILVAHISSKN